MRGELLFLAGAALSSCATVIDESDIKLTVAGPPLDASATGDAYLYEAPPTNAERNEGGAASQQLSMLGREDKAAAIDDEYEPAPCPPLDPMSSGEEAVLAHIIAAARDHRVVIINESHVVTRHRDFSRKIIAALRPHGYSVLAAETFANLPDYAPDWVDRLVDQTYIDRRLGYYSKEPVFGAMLREAKRLGYRFAAYEQPYDQDYERPKDWRIAIRDRETAQAANLAALVKTLGPKERLIVHVGYAHAREAAVVGEDGWDHAWMAARLKRDHGIDPLTISQTNCRGSADSVRLAMPSADQEGWFDMIVDHPIAKFRFGRPKWRLSEGREAVPVPSELQPTDQPLVIEAFVDGEPFDAVPVDRLWIEPGEDLRLVLEPGRYTVRAVRPAPTRND